MAVDIGRLRERVTLEALVTTTNRSGEQVASWQAEAELWASVEPLSGREQLQSQQMIALVTHRVWLRWHPGVRPDKRLRHEGRTLNFVSIVDRRERHELLECLCVEDTGK